MIKTLDSCKRCLWDLERNCMNPPTCKGCPRQLPNGICECINIPYGDECPYFEPWESEVEE